MKVLIVGSEGSMGKRYQAILKHLGYDFIKADKEHSPLDLVKLAIRCDRVIVATPTETHRDVLEAVLLAGKPVLCEKPITKNLVELQAIIDYARGYNPMLAMVMQYKYLLKKSIDHPVVDAAYKFLQDTKLNNASSYNYFRHGNDGLKWDCFQIIALADGEVSLGEDSPIWRCTLNGFALSLSDMDSAYVRMLREWLEKPYSDIDTLYASHEKVSKFKCK